MEKEIRSYYHSDKDRLNNPPVGLSIYDDDDIPRKSYNYDPNIDPQLYWSGKTERTSFDVPLVSLHIHETINPHQILKSARGGGHSGQVQTTLFDTDSLIARKERLEFYKHKRNWANRLIAGDSLLVMNSLLEKEGMAGKVQMIYVDPPYGIKYGSNFQPFVNKKNVEDGKDEDLTQEPEMIKAFRDTWELGIHSYLSYLRNRLLLSKDLLSDTGSIFVQISENNLHYIRQICDEIFGSDNFVTQIYYKKTTGAGSPGELTSLPSVGDYIVWYAKNKGQYKYNKLFKKKEFGGEGSSAYKKIELADGTRMSISQWEKQTGKTFDYKTRPTGSKVYALDNLTSQSGGENARFPIIFEGKEYTINRGSWKTSKEGIQRLLELRRIDTSDKGGIGYVRYFDDFSMVPLTNLWTDTVGQNQYGGEKKYVVQTAITAIQRCLLMTTDPGDLVLDITCGSGTTAYVAEQWGRRWITCDTSRVAITLTKQRIMAACYDYYRLLHPEIGISGGLEYDVCPHVMLKTLANNDETVNEYLIDSPIIDKTKIRVSGPFTVEAIPAPTVQSIDDPDVHTSSTSKQSQWRDELLATGIITRAGQKIEFTRIEPLSGTTYLQAEGETLSLGGCKRAVIHFASESHPLDQRMVNFILDETERIRPSPDMILFCAFQFDPEAAKFIDETSWPGVQLLKVQMNTDLLTEDLKKNRSNNQSFWMIGQPDVAVDKNDEGKFVVTVRGFDYYDVKTGKVESGDTKRISMWMLDTDYDGLSLNPSQIFFPMAGPKDGWAKLSRTLKVELDPDLIELYKGVVSIPFEINGPTKIAVKIIDDRGIESMKVLDLEGQS